MKGSVHGRRRPDPEGGPLWEAWCGAKVSSAAEDSAYEIRCFRCLREIVQYGQQAANRLRDLQRVRGVDNDSQPQPEEYQ